MRTGGYPSVPRHREPAEPYAVAAWQQMMVAAVGRQLGETDHGTHSAAHEPWAIADRHRDTGGRFHQRTRLCQDLQAVSHRVVHDEDRRDLSGANPVATTNRQGGRSSGGGVD